MRIQVISLFFILLFSIASHGAIENITGFHFQTCREETCFQMKAARALKGYFSRIFILEGPIEVVQTFANGSKKTWLGEDAFYDPVRMSFLVHGKRKDLLIEISKSQLVEFDKNQ